MQYQKNHSSILYYQELLISLSTQEKQWKLHLANLAYFCLELPIINVRNWVPEINLSVLSFWFTDETSYPELDNLFESLKLEVLSAKWSQMIGIEIAI